jgi:MULE transposase domain
MYPEVMGFDVTYGTNKEKRPLARGTIKTSSNKNVPIFNALLPSGASWVFHWIFHNAIPRLFAKESLAKLYLVLVDDDKHCNIQIDSARFLKKLPNAKYRLCKWHKINRNYQIKAKSFKKKDHTVDEVFFETFIAWLYSLCGQDCETEEELEYSLNSLDNWLAKQEDISPALRNETEGFLLKSFKPQIDKLAQCYFQHLYGGALGSNTLSEQENSALKRSSIGPRNNSGIDRSVAATVQYERGRLQGLLRHGLLSLSQTAVEDMDNESNSDDSGSNEEQVDSMNTGVVSNTRKELSKVLVDKAVKDVFHQSDVSVFYMYHACSVLCSSKFLGF